MRILQIALLIGLLAGSMCIMAADAAISNTSAAATVQPGPVVRTGLPASSDVRVNGRFAIRVPASAGGLSPRERADRIAQRLNSAFGAGMSWQDMHVDQSNGMWVVALGSQTIATADRNSARAFGVSTGTLASRWARQTVVAMGGQPQMIASQLQPVQTRVAGARQELGAANRPATALPAQAWATSPTKSVQLLYMPDGRKLGNVTIAGPRDELNTANSVVVSKYHTTRSTLWTFAPITGTSTSGTLTRARGVGLVALPDNTFKKAGLQTGPDVEKITLQMANEWNNRVTERLARRNLQSAADSRVVPLYSVDDGAVVGAAQIIGNARGVADANRVAMWRQGGMIRFGATTSRNPTAASPMLDDVVVSALLTMRPPSSNSMSGTATSSSNDKPSVILTDDDEGDDVEGEGEGEGGDGGGGICLGGDDWDWCDDGGPGFDDGGGFGFFGNGDGGEGDEGDDGGDDGEGGDDN